MRNGKPSHRPERLYNDDYSIVAQYQAEYRGFVQYYLMGFNAHRLWNVHRVMRGNTGEQTQINGKPHRQKPENRGYGW